MQRVLCGICSGAAFVVCMLAVHPALAQAYPAKTVRLIVPFPPGGGTDLLGRAIAQKLSERLGQQMVVDNRGGAGGNLGLEAAAKSPPDGYTIVLGSPGLAIGSSLYAKLNYDPAKDFAPISMVGAIENVVLVHPSVPAKTLAQLIEIARRNPGKLNYGSGGIGTTTHLAPELLKNLTSTNMVHVPYKGTGLALAALLGGEVDVVVMGVSAAAPQVQAGKARALAVLSKQRATGLPNVPTAKEAGIEDFEVTIWYCILAPAATSRDIISRLNGELAKAMTSQDMKERLAAIDIVPMTSTPEQAASFIRSEAARFAKVIKAAGIKAQ